MPLANYEQRDTPPASGSGSRREQFAVPGDFVQDAEHHIDITFTSGNRRSMTA